MADVDVSPVAFAGLLGLSAVALARLRRLCSGTIKWDTIRGKGSTMSDAIILALKDDPRFLSFSAALTKDICVRDEEDGVKLQVLRFFRATAGLI